MNSTGLISRFYRPVENRLKKSYIFIISFCCPTRCQVPPVLKSIFIFRTLTPNVGTLAAFEAYFVHYAMVVYGEENKAIIKTCATLFPAISFFAYYLENTTTALCVIFMILVSLENVKKCGVGGCKIT